MITLRRVDKTTFESVIELTLAPKDERRLASNLYSLAQAYLYRDEDSLEPLAILAGEMVVGFLLLLKDSKKQEYFIWRLMIDHSHQNKGYGKEALRLIIERARKDSACRQIVTSYVIGNHRMRSILHQMGFHSLGLSGNEIVMTLDLI